MTAAALAPRRRPRTTRRTGVVLALAALTGLAHGEPKPPAASTQEASAEPKLSAKAAVLVDVASGQVLYAREADAPREPASLTKIMTALLTVEAGDLDRTVTVSQHAAETGEASANLEAGDQLHLRDLLVAALLPSANDASVAIAEAVDGSESAFVQRMNARARELGLTQTHFVNPNGLPAAGHMSSARDLAEMAREALTHEEFRRTVALEKANLTFRRPKAKGPETREVVTTNRLLRRGHPEHWARADGVKTGYTRAAGRCLCASATQDGWQLLTVVLGCEDSWADARALLGWGFAGYRRVRVVRAYETAVDVHILGGREPTVRALARSDVDLIVPAAEPAPTPRLAEAYAEAPVGAGDEVGELVLNRLDGAAVTATLVAAEEAPRSLWARLGDHAGALAIGVVALALIGAVLAHGAVAAAAGARRRRIAEKVRRAREERARDGEPQRDLAPGAADRSDTRSGAA